MVENNRISNGVSLINILGVDINTFTKKQALAKIRDFLAGSRQHFIITPNPEIILQAVKPDEEFFAILNKADLALPDGIGLKIAAWLMSVNLSRITGADLLKDMLAMAEEENRRVVVFNWQDGLSSESDIKKALADKYPRLRVLTLNIERRTDLPAEKLVQAKEFQPEIIFCALGAPYQEKLIFYNLANLPTVKIGLGVGGAFDFLTGRIKRAPKIFRNLGLEWFWRLIKQPWRWRRIYNAVIVFPIKFLIWRFIKK